MARSLKRIFIDIGGYLLIVLGLATGWLPGPGGIPLVLGGLALLSLHNNWAKRLRQWLVRHGADFILKLFPENPKLQLVYDGVAGMLLALIAWLVWNRQPWWIVGVTSGLFLFVLAIVGLNRDHILQLRRKHGGDTESEPEIGFGGHNPYSPKSESGPEV